MGKVLGVHIAKGHCRFSVLEGSKTSPTLVDKGRLITPGIEDVPALMNWYDSQFRQLITSYQPSKIAYRLTLEPNKDQLICSEFPLGVLNLIAHQRSLPITGYTAKSFTPSRAGLPKNSDLYAECDTQLGKHPPYWDDAQKHSAIVAWFEL